MEEQSGMVYREARSEIAARPGIIRNRQNIEAAARNARAFLSLQQEFGSFDAFAWRFMGGYPKVNRWKPMPSAKI